MLVTSIDQLAAGKVQPGAQVELFEAVEKSKSPLVTARWAKQQAAWTAKGDALAPFSFALAGASRTSVMVRFLLQSGCGPAGGGRGGGAH